MSMEMASSIIIDLLPFNRQRDLPLGVNSGVERLNSIRYGPSDLASLDQFWIFSLGRREDNYPCNIFSAATSSTMVILLTIYAHC
jgi:hypothetical protein